MNSSQLVIESLVRNIIVRLLESSGTHKNTWAEIVLNTPDHISTFLSSLLTIKPRISRGQLRSTECSQPRASLSGGYWHGDTLETGDMSHLSHVTHDTHCLMSHVSASLPLLVTPVSALMIWSWHHGNNQLSWLSNAILMIALKILIQCKNKIIRSEASILRLKVKSRIVKIKTRLSISMVSHWWMVVSYSRSPQSDIQHLDYVRNSAKIFPQTGGHQYLRRFTTHCFFVVLLIHDFL